MDASQTTRNTRKLAQEAIQNVQSNHKTKYSQWKISTSEICI